jgi:hypothetical protein
LYRPPTGVYATIYAQRRSLSRRIESNPVAWPLFEAAAVMYDRNGARTTNSTKLRRHVETFENFDFPLELIGEIAAYVVRCGIE